MRKTLRENNRIPESAKVYKTSRSGRVYWAKRNALGQFVSWDGSQGSPEYDAYLSARMDAAEAATKGNMVSRAGREKWVSADDIMRPGGGLRYATDELRDWLLIHGRTMSIRDFRAQSDEKGLPNDLRFRR
jgi:hypothetical protein